MLPTMGGQTALNLAKALAEVQLCVIAAAAAALPSLRLLHCLLCVPLLNAADSRRHSCCPMLKS